MDEASVSNQQGMVGYRIPIRAVRARRRRPRHQPYPQQPHPQQQHPQQQPRHHEPFAYNPRYNERRTDRPELRQSPRDMGDGNLSLPGFRMRLAYDAQRYRVAMMSDPWRRGPHTMPRIGVDELVSQPIFNLALEALETELRRDSPVSPSQFVAEYMEQHMTAEVFNAGNRPRYGRTSSSSRRNT